MHLSNRYSVVSLSERTHTTNLFVWCWKQKWTGLTGFCWINSDSSRFNSPSTCRNKQLDGNAVWSHRLELQVDTWITLVKICLGVSFQILSIYFLFEQNINLEINLANTHMYKIQLHTSFSIKDSVPCLTISGGTEHTAADSPENRCTDKHAYAYTHGMGEGSRRKSAHYSTQILPVTFKPADYANMHTMQTFATLFRAEIIEIN